MPPQWVFAKKAGTARGKFHKGSSGNCKGKGKGKFHKGGKGNGKFSEGSSGKGKAKKIVPKVAGDPSFDVFRRFSAPLRELQIRLCQR